MGDAGHAFGQKMKSAVSSAPALPSPLPVPREHLSFLLPCPRDPVIPWCHLPREKRVSQLSVSLP